MTSELSSEEILAVLDATNTGEVTTREEDRAKCLATYCGNVEFLLSNGWTVTVFNDCDSFDYVDSVRAPDGRVAEYKPTLPPFRDGKAYLDEWVLDPDWYRWEATEDAVHEVWGFRRFISTPEGS